MKNPKLDLKLIFSGGGLRATFYSLGAYRRLVELGLEENVDELSSVSGGSLTAGKIMVERSQKVFENIEDFDRRVTAPLKNIGKINLRQQIWNEAFFSKLWKSFPTYISYLSFPLHYCKSRLSNGFIKVLDKELFNGKLMRDLINSVDWSCNATCLNTKKRFRFKKNNMYGFGIGESEDIADISVAFAVATSAAFPMMFRPLKLDIKNRIFKSTYKWPISQLGESILLTDGGVYDNLGSEAFLRKEGCEERLIILDASAASKFSSNNSLPNAILSTIETSMDQIVLLRRRLLFQMKGTKCIQLILGRPLEEIIEYQKLTNGSDVDLGLYESFENQNEELLSQLRTDLDIFHDIEIDLLMWSGAIKMDIALRILFPRLLNGKPIPLKPQYSQIEIEKILTKGIQRSIFGQVHER